MKCRMKSEMFMFAACIALGFVVSAAQAAELLSISHDGTAGAENNPFDTVILDGSSDWTYTTDGARSVMTALDNSASGNNRLILVGADGISQFNDTGTAADKGWVFEIEFEILQGNSGGTSYNFASFGVRSEDGAGKAAWVGLNNDGGVGDKGRISFPDYTTGKVGSIVEPLDVDSLIGDGQYHNFKIHKYDNGGTPTVDVFLDGSLVLSSPYASLDNDPVTTDIQGFVSSTPVPLSEVTIDFINFTLYDNLSESAPPPDNDAPVITTLSPENNEPHVLQAPTSLVVFFDELILANTTGSIVISNRTDNSTTSIPINDASQVTVSGGTLTITPTESLAFNTPYAVLIDTNALKDVAGNFFAGIPGATNWWFETDVITVLADINADGTDRTATTGDFEDAAGLATGTFSGETVTVFGGTEESGAYSETKDNVTLAISDKSGGADNWFGGNSQTGPGSSPNNLLEDGFYNSGFTPRTITLSGSGLGLTPGRRYELYLFAGRSQGHDTTFRFNVNDPENPSGGVGIDTDPPVVGGDETLGTAMFTFEIGKPPPASLVVQWDEHDPSVDPVFSGFALRDIGIELTPPAIDNLSPTNNATGVSLTPRLVATFNEEIVTNTTGSIVISNRTTTATTSIDIGDTSQVTVSGTTLTITPTGIMDTNTPYAVLIDTNALKDAVGNFFAGIPGATNWWFETGKTLAYWAYGSPSTLSDISGRNDLTGGEGIVSSTMSLAPDPVPNPDAATTGSAGSILTYSVITPIAPKTANAAPFKMTSASSFTFEGWLKTTETDGVIAGDRHSSTSWKGWYCLLTSGAFRFFFNSGTAAYIDSSTAVNDDSPHHFAAVWDHAANEMRVYIDGDLQGTASPSVGSYTQSAGFGIGGRATSSDNIYNDNLFSGRLDELRFSRAALAPSEFLPYVYVPPMGTVIVIY